MHKNSVQGYWPCASLLEVDDRSIEIRAEILLNLVHVFSTAASPINISNWIQDLKCHSNWILSDNWYATVRKLQYVALSPNLAKLLPFIVTWIEPVPFPIADYYSTNHNEPIVQTQITGNAEPLQIRTSQRGKHNTPGSFVLTVQIQNVAKFSISAIL